MILLLVHQHQLLLILLLLPLLLPAADEGLLHLVGKVLNTDLALQPDLHIYIYATISYTVCSFIYIYCQCLRQAKLGQGIIARN